MHTVARELERLHLGGFFTEEIRVRLQSSAAGPSSSSRRDLSFYLNLYVIRPRVRS